MIPVFVVVVPAFLSGRYIPRIESMMPLGRPCMLLIYTTMLGDCLDRKKKTRTIILEGGRSSRKRLKQTTNIK